MSCTRYEMIMRKHGFPLRSTPTNRPEPMNDAGLWAGTPLGLVARVGESEFWESKLGLVIASGCADEKQRLAAKAKEQRRVYREQLARQDAKSEWDLLFEEAS